MRILFARVDGAFWLNGNFELGTVRNERVYTIARRLSIILQFSIFHCLQQKQARICTLYLPLLSVLLDHVPRFHGSKHDLSNQPYAPYVSQTSSTMAVPNSDFGGDSNRSSSYSAALKPSPTDSLTPQAASSLKEATQIALQVPLDEDETKELLLCAMYIFKNLDQGEQAQP